MIYDIYCRNSNDPRFSNDELEMSSDLDIFLSEIEMILLTNKTEILGEPDFGASLDAQLHSFNFSAGKIKGEIERQIDEYATLSKQFNWRIDVNFVKGTLRDIGIIDVYIEGVEGAAFGIIVN